VGDIDGLTCYAFHTGHEVLQVSTIRKQELQRAAQMKGAAHFEAGPVGFEDGFVGWILDGLPQKFGQGSDDAGKGVGLNP